MIPHRASFADWWTNTAYEESGYDDVFYHDVPSESRVEARRKERGEDSKALHELPGLSKPAGHAHHGTSVETTACSPPPGRAGMFARASASSRTRWTAAARRLSRPSELAERLASAPPVAGEEASDLTVARAYDEPTGLDRAVQMIGWMPRFGLLPLSAQVTPSSTAVRRIVHDIDR